MFLQLCIVLFVLLSFVKCQPFPPCLFEDDEYSSDDPNRPDLENRYKNTNPPSEIDWRWHNSQSYTSPVRNSFVGTYCGSCWAFAATSALTDRIRIATNNSSPETVLSPQVLLDCDTKSNGCQGGSVTTAYEYIEKYGIPSESCSPYSASEQICDAKTKCRYCKSPGVANCIAVRGYQAWTITGHSYVKGEDYMMNEISAYGPIVCTMTFEEPFLNYYGFSIYESEDTNPPPPNMAVSIVGYGEENGTPYWIGRNSWGDYWGANGYFRIIRGSNKNLGLEQNNCYYANPKSSSIWIDEYTTFPLNTNSNLTYIEPSEPTKQTEPIDFTNDKSSYPDDFSWTNINGNNYVTPVRNQDVPTVCQSDWAYGILGMMSDRINTVRVFDKQPQYPEFILSVQSLIDIKTGSLGGNCYGCGNLYSVFKFIHKYWVPVETCNLYRAMPENGYGNDAPLCFWCGYAAPPNTPCEQIHNFTAFSVSHWGQLPPSINPLQQQIYTQGPIVCGMDATQQFIDYTGGVFSQSLFDVTVNHYVEVVGWGVDHTNGTSQQYWLAKNSWGSFWGEKGFFRINMNSNNLGIETACFWATVVPKLPH